MLRQTSTDGLPPHETVVTRWFGPQFDRLHPLLQDLHRHGGTLRGIVTIDLGRGVAGWIGRRLANRLGIPADVSKRGFEVDIRHTADALHWNRRFDNGDRVSTVFYPVGTWPSGHWIERTGKLHMTLTVDVINGGWHWRALGFDLGGLRLPIWLFPRSRAYKQIKDGKYFFSVAFVVPVLGTVLRYEGLLAPEIHSALRSTS
ncbi:MAG: DUF4166 domain-containing protein [Gammaproteobacteria bacterium]|nr:DUF4166 domain-containing protein [Gammaproteobacteria bacterium]